MIEHAHFIYLGGQWTPQHDRAIDTAHVHSRFVTVHHILPPTWLAEHPIGLANVKDYYAYRILRAWGGIYLDFDTISLRPAWDLLTADVCMSTEFLPGDEAGEPYNTAVMLAKKDAPILLELEMESYRLLVDGCAVWGALGPHLISRFYRANPEPFSPAPFGALNGWSYHSIGNYYAEPRDPGEHVRVIHGYSSDHPEWWRDTWTPTT